MTTPTATPPRALPVHVHGLTKGFGDRPVLAGLDLDVRAGEVLAVLGPSGCGKSTLLRLLAGLETPDAGRLVLADRPVTDVDDRAAVVFQQPRLLPWLDLRGNVALGAVRRRRTDASAGDRQEVDALLHRVGLHDAGHLRPAQVSGGMAQRAALARALLARPSVLLLDEPFAALDALTRLRMQQLVDGLVHGEGTTAVLVTHDVDEALRLADRVVVLGPAGSGSLTQVTVDVDRPRDTTDPATAAALAPLRRGLLRLVGVEDAA